MEDNIKGCQYQYFGRHCGRDLYDDEHCIFHSEDIEGKKKDFNEIFFDEMLTMPLDNEYNFSGFIFPGDITFLPGSNFDKKVIFDKAKFHGKAEFDWVEFNNNVSFHSTEFYRKTLFRHTIFKKVIFINVYFEKLVNFAHAKFLDVVNFIEPKFPEGALFSDVQFFKEFFLADMDFVGGIRFDKVKFNREVKFDEVEFKKDITFEKSEFFGRTEFIGIKFFGATSFNQAKFRKEVYFIDITVEKNNDFEMKDVNLSNVSGLFEFIKENRKKFSYSKVPKLEFLPANFRLILGEETVARYPVISRQIRDDMYLLEFQRLHPKLYKCWQTFADCGRSFLRWALWSILLAVFFAIIFSPPPSFFPDWWISLCNKIGPSFQQTADAYKGESFGFSSSLYFSIVTFTTLGFGDVVTANNVARFLVTIEVIAGYIMLGGLISILANKLARRS